MRRGIGLWACSLVILTLWLLNAFFASGTPWGWLNLNNEKAVLGQIGDTFGVTNSLFSALALLGVVYSILLQKQELGETRSEMAKQSLQLEIQSRQFVRQEFEGRFFKLLEQLNDLRQEIQFASHTGIRALAELETILDFEISTLVGQGEEADAAVASAFEEIRDNFANEISAYYRFIYSLLRFVAGAPHEDRSFYSDIVSSQFSDAELKLLFANCLTSAAPNTRVLVKNLRILSPLRATFQRNPTLEGVLEKHFFKN